MNFRLMVATVVILSTALTPIARAEAQDLSPQRLKKLLQRFPQADLNQDGTLTKEEAVEAISRVRGQRKSKPDVAPQPKHEDVKYGPYDRNLFDIWVPESETPTPLIVQIHGGGFVGGDKTGVRKQNTIQNALDHGVAFAAINYRFRHLPGSSGTDPQRAGIQDILRDAARAIQFIRHHAAQYNIDPARVACYGGSAGAGTSIWLAFHDDLADPDHKDPVLRQSSRVSAVGMLAGQYTYDIEQWDADFADRGGDLARLNGGTKQDFADFFAMSWDDYRNSGVRQDVDMRGLISADDAPVFAVSTLADEPVDSLSVYYHHPRHALLIEERCRREGVECVCFVPKVRQQDAAALKADPDAMLHFFFKHLGVESN